MWRGSFVGVDQIYGTELGRDQRVVMSLSKMCVLTSDQLVINLVDFAFSALTLLVGRDER